MKKGTIAIIVAGVILLGLVLWLGTSLIKANAEKEAAKKEAAEAKENSSTGQTIVMPADPCADTAQMRADAEAADKAAADAAKDAAAKKKALKNAIRKCQPNFANGDTSYVIIINQQTGATGNRKSGTRTTGGQRKISLTAEPGQQVSSSYEGADKPIVVQNYKQSSAGAITSCWNIQADANGRPKGGKFWPHLEATDPRPFVPEAVPNGQTPIGYNLLMPSVPFCSTSYGQNRSEKVAWCLCSILDNDKFGGATNVVYNSDDIGWPDNWLPATIENVNGKSYYVVRW